LLWGAFSAGCGAAAGSPESAVATLDVATAPLQRCEFVEPHMGTLFQLVIFAPDPVLARPAAQAAFARIAELNRIFSDFDDRSEAMRLCRQPAGRPVLVSVELHDVLQRSQHLAELSAGAFDATLGPLIRQWRDARSTQRLPSPEAIAAARQVSGFTLLHLDPSDRTVTLRENGMRLDFGGIAKGYAADEALAVLRRFGFASAMVAASGDLALGEPPPGDKGWRIALSPFGESPSQSAVVVAANVGLSTSADAEQFIALDGLRYSHILDPRTGLGLTSPMGVTVVAPNATLSDSLATACSILTIEEGRRLLHRIGEPVRVFMQPRGNNPPDQFRSYGTGPVGLQSANFDHPNHSQIQPAAQVTPATASP